MFGQRTLMTQIVKKLFFKKSENWLSGSYKEYGQEVRFLIIMTCEQ